MVAPVIFRSSVLRLVYPKKLRYSCRGGGKEVDVNVVQSIKSL